MGNSPQEVLVVAPVLHGRGAGAPVRHPPILALYVAGGLLEAGFRAHVADLYHLGDQWEERLAAAGPADLVVLIYREYDRPLPEESFARTVAAAARAFPAARLAVAGVYDRAEAQERLTRYPALTAAFRRLPEHDLPRWLAGETLPGTVLERDRQPPAGAPPAVDLDALPMPAWELVDIDLYGAGAAHRYKVRPNLPVIAIRGCPFHCYFCDKKGFCASRNVVLRDPGKVAEEVRTLRVRFGVREVQFAEPVFNVDKSWVLAMCNALEGLESRTWWSCHVRADHLDEEQIAAMARAGCWNLLMGVESASEAVREGIGKPLTLRQVDETLRLCRRYDIETTASFVFGLPGDTPASIRETIRAAVALAPDYAQFFLHKAQFDEAKLPGDRVLPEWDFALHDIPGRPYLPAAFADVAELEALRREAYRRFYLRPRYVMGRLRRLSEPAELLRLARGAVALVKLSR